MFHLTQARTDFTGQLNNREWATATREYFAIDSLSALQLQV